MPVKVPYPEGKISARSISPATAARLNKTAKNRKGINLQTHFTAITYPTYDSY
jgi:hypothetical protein